MAALFPPLAAERQGRETPGAAGGEIRVAAGGDLQAAINRATPGDTILLAAGARFTGNFILPAHGGTTFITIRTEAPGLPGPGERTSPRHSGRLAVLQSATNVPALRTAPAAHHWRVENVEFGPTRNGDDQIILLGETGSRQRSREQVPHTLILDRVYVHGDPAVGQKRGIALNSASTQVVNSYIADIKGVGVDTQAIAGWNGPGPYLIENNYLEAAGENILFGGGDPSIDGLVPTDITIRGNHITRPLAWREPILATPADVRAAPGGDGRLRAGTYVYRVVAERRVSGDVAVSAAGESAPVTVSGGGSATVTWSPAAGAAAFRIYRTGGSGGDVFWRSTEPRFTDDGGAGDAGTPPKRATVWTVKNLLELKNARQVQIVGNLFEHHWQSAQPGYAIVFTPRNQEGGAPWSRIEDVTFADNIVRHVSGGINITGTDDEQPSERTRNLTIRNNLFADVSGAAWGGPGDFVQIGNAPAGVRIENNTVVHTGRIASLYGNSRLGREATGVTIRNNVFRHNRYGIHGGDAAPGADTFQKYLPGAVFEGNIIGGGEASRYPGRNRFIDAGEFDALFADAPKGDFRLKPGAAPGVGADMSALRTAATANTTAPAAPAPRPRSKG